MAAAVAELSPRPLTIIVPRHPELSGDILRDLAAHRLAVRSTGEAIEPETEVYLADTLGEMGLFLRLADVAVMGGGFSPGIGGHNPLEPARLGVGAISGPYVANYAEIYAEMSPGGRRADRRRRPALARALAGLLADRGRLDALNRAAADFAGRQGDRLDRRARVAPAAAAGPMRLATPRWWYVRRGAPAPLTRALLKPISWIWAYATARRIASARPFDPGVPVICVGNLTMGGTGKTPVVRALTRRLVGEGRKVHVLTPRLWRAAERSCAGRRRRMARPRSATKP